MQRLILLSCSAGNGWNLIPSPGVVVIKILLAVGSGQYLEDRGPGLHYVSLNWFAIHRL